MKLSALVVALLTAFALKVHYATASADDLWWMLAPTAQVVGVITAVPFTLEPGEGYLSRERMFLIEKSCAGVNFMVAAFAMLVFALLHRVRSAASAARVLSASLGASYAASVAVNAVRIALALWLAVHPVALPAVSAQEIHRIEGILVYFGGLVLLYEMATRLDRHGELAR